MTGPIIVHHYPGSPFAEKLRLALGARALDWLSVDVAMMLPRPELMQLSGGYRRVPVMQIGADVYCDTALILRVLERIAPIDPQPPEPAERVLADTLAQWADRDLFAAAVAFGLQRAGLGALFAGMDEPTQRAFIEDRRRMREGASVARLALPEAGAALHDGMARLQALLIDGRPWLFGEQVCDADFSAYHPLWFIARAPELASVFSAYPKIAGWMARVAAIGHGRPRPITSAQALEIARDAQPVDTGHASAREDDPWAIGMRLQVTPTDYAISPVQGLLAVCDAERVALRRQVEGLGEVVVHFPRQGYSIKAPAE